MRTALLALTGLLLALAPPPQRPRAAPPDPATLPAVPVVVRPARLAPVEHVVRSAGRLQAVRVHRAHSEIQGRLLELPHRPGDAVEAGALLARIDDTLIRAELAKAVAQREQAQADLSRMERLHARKGASEDELLKARTALAVARADEHLARARLERTRITAPFSGIVSERLAEPGDTVSPGTHLLTLIDPTLLEVALPVPDRVLPRLRPGHPVALRIDGLERRIPDARIARIHPEVDPSTLKGTVVVTLDPAPEGAHPGLLVRARLRLRGPPALRIPLAALRRTSEGTWVWRVTRQDTVERVPVEVGALVGDEIVVRSGLDEGDRVVVRGFIRLRSGRRAEVVEETAP
jgi:membrane fusion protein (multidrug efflux system)